MSKHQVVDRSDPTADEDLINTVRPEMERLLRELYDLADFLTAIVSQNFQAVLNPVIEKKGSGKVELIPIVQGN